MSKPQYDVLVIGSGIAGLTFAVKMATERPDIQIAIITKADEEETNTKYAQGGVAAVFDLKSDSYEKHIADTLDAGDGLCKVDIVQAVVEEGPERVREIIAWGTEFDRSESGDYHLGKEGGHTAHRVLHHKDVTGKEIERALLNRIHELSNIHLFSHYYVIDLITQHHLGMAVTRMTEGIRCFGVYMLNTQSRQIEKVLSKLTILASGGVGQVYKSTTNPVIATGDGIAMVYRAKGRVENMEFIQFHPTSLYHPGESPSFLISEAVRGSGGVLKTATGEEFMHKYDERGSLAPRDIVARAIDHEMKTRGDEFVYLDCTSIPADTFRDHFPNILDKCHQLGIHPEKDYIPVVPSAHYACGGVQVDAVGRSSIECLYACGECASTGLHGANRLASNSLLEAMVFAHRIFEDCKQRIDGIVMNEQFPDWSAEGTTEPGEMVLITQGRKELQEIMSTYVGIVRSNIRLKKALDRLLLLFQETETLYETTTISPQLCELRNMITVGYLITRSSAFRKESRGLHFTTDYPIKSRFLQHSVF